MPKKSKIDPTRCRCQDCGNEYALSELDTIDDVKERVQPGETYPPGQCPDFDCGALCQFIDQLAAAKHYGNPESTLYAQAEAMSELLCEAINGWPQLDGNDEVNGGDLVEWFKDWRQRAKDSLRTGEYHGPEGLDDTTTKDEALA